MKNYDGSWTEYGSLVGVPIELGEAKRWPATGAARPRAASALTVPTLGNQAVVEGRVTPTGPRWPPGTPGCSAPATSSWPRCRSATTAGSGSSPPPGRGPLRVLAPGGLRAEQAVQADYGQVTKVEVAL